MANTAPVMRLTASETNITLPNNKVTLNSSGSVDKNRRGKEVPMAERSYYSRPAGVIFSNVDEINFTCVAEFPKDDLYIVGVEGTDAAGLTGTAEVTVLVKPAIVRNKTIFGASGPSIDSPDFLMQLCGMPTVSRTTIILDQYRGMGSKELERYLDAGVTMFLNVNVSAVQKDGQGNKIPNPIITDMGRYTNMLEPVLKYYANHPKKDKIIINCENEITTEVFHVGKMSDYLIQLKTCAALCKKYGFKVTDSGVHVVTVLGADDPDGQGKSAQVAELLQGFAQIPELYAVCMHTNNGRDGNYDMTSTKRAVDKVMQITGHKTVSNEWHVQNGTPTVIAGMAQSWADAGVDLSVYITGTTNDVGSLLNQGTDLTAIGKAYRDKIAQLARV